MAGRSRLDFVSWFKAQYSREKACSAAPWETSILEYAGARDFSSEVSVSIFEKPRTYIDSRVQP